MKRTKNNEALRRDQTPRQYQCSEGFKSPQIRLLDPGQPLLGARHPPPFRPNRFHPPESEAGRARRPLSLAGGTRLHRPCSCDYTNRNVRALVPLAKAGVFLAVNFHMRVALGLVSLLMLVGVAHADPPDFDHALTSDLMAVRDGIDQGTLSRAGRRAATAAKTRAEEYLKVNFPELNDMDPALQGIPHEEANVRLLGRAFVRGWQTIGFGTNGEKAGATRQLKSPDGKWTYDLFASPTSGKLSLASIRMQVTEGITMAWTPGFQDTDMEVEFTHGSADGRSTTSRTYKFALATLSKATVTYRNGTSVSHELGMKFRRGTSATKVDLLKKPTRKPAPARKK